MRRTAAAGLGQNQQPFDHVPHRQFVGHAHAAVKLYCLLADMSSGTADLYLGGGYSAHAFGARARTAATERRVAEEPSAAAVRER